MGPVAGDAPVAEGLSDLAARLITNIEQVVRGRHEAVQLVVIALMAGGHALIEDLPGTGKTTLARAVARSVDGSFQRVQATADLLPADITGSSVWNPGQHRFEFVPGPVFAHVLLVDELNRTPPRTQSAFLEVMEEGSVTVDRVSHRVPDPFFVIATQNPFEQHGTYPLPEGQLDRFAVQVRLGALDEQAEAAVLREQLAGPTVDDLRPVLDARQLRQIRAAIRQVHAAQPVLDYGLAVVRGTRQHPAVRVGASARAAITLLRCAQAHAVLRGRDYVTPDDVQALAVPVLAHRLQLQSFASPAVPAEGGTPSAESVVREVAVRTPVPVGR